MRTGHIRVLIEDVESDGMVFFRHGACLRYGKGPGEPDTDYKDAIVFALAEALAALKGWDEPYYMDILSGLVRTLTENGPLHALAIAYDLWFFRGTIDETNLQGM